MSKRYFKLSLRPALAYAALSLGLPVLCYGLVQQDLRQSANDPQIQLAEDAAQALAQGATPESLANTPPVNMRASLAPFITIVDATYRPLASTGRLDDQIVLPPAGAFEAAQSSRHRAAPSGQNRLTWQPAPDVREAAVIVHYPGGYVLAARNLREVEIREQRTLGYAAAGAAALGVIGLLISSNMFKRKP